MIRPLKKWCYNTLHDILQDTVHIQNQQEIPAWPLYFEDPPYEPEQKTSASQFDSLDLQSLSRYNELLTKPACYISDIRSAGAMSPLAFNLEDEEAFSPEYGSLGIADDGRRECTSFQEGQFQAIFEPHLENLGAGLTQRSMQHDVLDAAWRPEADIRSIRFEVILEQTQMHSLPISRCRLTLSLTCCP